MPAFASAGRISGCVGRPWHWLEAAPPIYSGLVYQTPVPVRGFRGSYVHTFSGMTSTSRLAPTRAQPSALFERELLYRTHHPNLSYNRRQNKTSSPQVMPKPFRSTYLIGAGRNHPSKNIGVRHAHDPWKSHGDKAHRSRPNFGEAPCHFPVLPRSRRWQRSKHPSMTVIIMAHTAARRL